MPKVLPKLLNMEFANAAAERAISTFAQALVGVLSLSGLGLADVSWGAMFSAAAVAGLASVAKSIAVAGLTDGGPSVGNVEKLDQT